MMLWKLCKQGQNNHKDTGSISNFLQSGIAGSVSASFPFSKILESTIMKFVCLTMAEFDLVNKFGNLHVRNTAIPGSLQSQLQS